MFTRIRNLHPFGLVAVGVVSALVLSGTAIAVTDASFTYSTVQTGYLTIDPLDLAPSGHHDANSYSVSTLGDLHAFNGGCYNTGVNLPQAARITTLRTYYRSGVSSQVALVRNNLSTDQTEFLVTMDIPGTGGSRQSVTHIVPMTLRPVWNNVYSYGFSICLGANDTFHGARITYTYTSAGD